MAKRRRRRNPGNIECALRARWAPFGKTGYILEVFVVGKWRRAGSVHARTARMVTQADLKKVATSVRTNTGGQYEVVELRLERHGGYV